MALPGRTQQGNYAEPTEAVETEAPEPETSDGSWTQKQRPAGNFIKFQNAGDSVEGVLKGFFESEYEGKTSTNATLHNGVRNVTIRLTTQLTQYFEGVTVGSKVKIVYKGRIGKMKNYDFFVAG